MPVFRALRAKFTPSTLVQTLVYGWLANPTASVGQLAQMAARVGVDVSPQAIDRRFTMTTATLLHQVLSASMEAAIAAEPKPVHVPRERPAPVVLDEGPLILVETKRDLRNLSLPF